MTDHPKPTRLTPMMVWTVPHPKSEFWIQLTDENGKAFDTVPADRLRPLPPSITREQQAVIEAALTETEAEEGGGKIHGEFALAVACENRRAATRALRASLAPPKPPEPVDPQMLNLELAVDTAVTRLRDARQTDTADRLADAFNAVALATPPSPSAADIAELIAAGEALAANAHPIYAAIQKQRWKATVENMQRKP